VFEDKAMKPFTCSVCAFVALSFTILLAAPEPAVVQEPGLWTLDVTFEHPQQILLRRSNGTERFWYVIISATNTTDRDIDFYPKCELMTDTFRILPAVAGASPALIEQIKTRHKTKYPFLQSLDQAGNKILQGRDNTKDIAVIWPDFDPNAKALKCFISGLSNETAVVEHPVLKNDDGTPVSVYLRKTLELSYALSGDPAFRSEQKLDYEQKRWVMR